MDADVRALERSFAKDRTDQDTLARLLAARRRAKLPATGELLAARVFPARTFTTRFKLLVCVVLPDGRLDTLARTNMGGAGDTVPVPAHRLLVLMPLERREPLEELVASLADEPALGLRLTSGASHARGAELPAATLARLPGLERLEADGVKVTAKAAAALAKCGALAVVELSGEVEPAALPALAKLPALVDLRLPAVEHPDFAPLAAAPHLERLALRGGTFGVAAARALAKAPALRALHLDGVEGLDGDVLGALAGWPRLERLGLEDGVTDEAATHLAALERLVALELAHVEGQGLTLGVCKALAKLGRLERLDLDGCRQLQDDGLAALARGLPGLVHLDLRLGEQVTSKGLGALGGLARLARLRLDACSKVDDAAVKAAAALPALEALDLKYCGRVTDTGVAALAKARRLAELDLSRTKTGAKGLAALVKAGTPLRALSLAEADDALLAEASRLTGLRLVCFDVAPGLTPAGLAALAKLPELEDLCAVLPKRFGKKDLKPLRAARPGLRLRVDVPYGGSAWTPFGRDA